MKTLSLLIILLISTNLFSATIRDIDFTIDTTNFGKTNQFSVKIYLIKKNGKRTEILPNSPSIHWGKIAVTGQHIQSFKHGIITYNQSEITNENNTIQLDVAFNKRKFTMQKEIKFAYVSGLILKNSLIQVNHKGILDYELIFNNGKTAQPSSTLFLESNFIVESVNEVKVLGSSIYMQLNEPFLTESINLKINSKLNNKLLGSKSLIIQYPTSCSIEANGQNGQNGTTGVDGKKTSENGTSGNNGTNGLSGNDVRLFCKMSTVNQTKFLTIQSFSSDGTHLTEIIKYEGKGMTLTSKGGNGGNGGNGGKGMTGLIQVDKQINSPLGGNGGNGGNAGNGGNGGNVYFVFPTETGDISSLFNVSTTGGNAGTAGLFGKGGKGDYSDGKIIGKILTIRDGKDGNNGVNGVSGNMTLLKPISLLPNDQWNSLLTKHLNEGFIK